MFTLHKTRMNLSTRDPNHQNDGFWVPSTLFKKKYEWPKFGSLDRISVTKNIFILKNGNQSSIPNFGRFWGFKKFRGHESAFIGRESAFKGRKSACEGPKSACEGRKSACEGYKCACEGPKSACEGR